MQVYATSTLLGFAQSVPYTSPIAFFSSAPAASFESWLPSHAAQSYWLSDHIWKRYSCKFQNFLACSWLKIGRFKVSSDQCVLFLLFPFGFACGFSLQQQTKHMCHQTTSRNIYIYMHWGANQTELTNRQLLTSRSLQRGLACGYHMIWFSHTNMSIQNQKICKRRVCVFGWYSLVLQVCYCKPKTKQRLAQWILRVYLYLSVFLFMHLYLSVNLSI